MSALEAAGLRREDGRLVALAGLDLTVEAWADGLADRRVADVRAWWRIRHPPPGLAQRLDVAYTTVLVGAIFGAVAYGTAGSALAEVLSPERLERFGAPAALSALVLVARWGA